MPFQAKAIDNLFLRRCKDCASVYQKKGCRVSGETPAEEVCFEFTPPTGEIGWFCRFTSTWMTVTTRCVCMTVTPEGRVSIFCVDDKTDAAHNCSLQITHPKELAEIIRLLTLPPNVLTAPFSSEMPHVLSEIADIYILVYTPYYRTTLFCADHIPPRMPKDLAQIIAKTLTHDDPELRDVNPEEWIERHRPKIIDTLCDADAVTDVGYILSRELRPRHAIPIMARGLQHTLDTLIPILVVPRGIHQPNERTLSSFYLSQYLNIDQAAYVYLQDTFAAGSDLKTICGKLCNMPISAPCYRTEQIRRAMQAATMREEILFCAQMLTKNRVPFGDINHHYLHVATEISNLVDWENAWGPP